MQIIEFYKTASGHWYADLPDYIASGGSVEECEMVSGADTFLDMISHGKPRIKTVFDLNDGEDATYKLEKHHEENDAGTSYLVNNTLLIWLCPVTLFVFEVYPAALYVHVLRDE